MTSTPLLFNLHSDPVMAAKLNQQLEAEEGRLNTRQFPDGETYLRVDSDCQGRDALVFCNLYDPDAKIMALLFLADTLRELGARRIALITPYLCYMRQDTRFHAGECISQQPFARLLSRYFDYLITVDPHLHRIDHLDQVYSLDSTVVQAAPLIAAWLRQLDQPLVLIGPDSESEQWVGAVARLAEAPFVVLEKIRHGDREVEISPAALEHWPNHRPVLVDDIISSGKTMLQTLAQLETLPGPRPLCIGVHGLFADDAYQQLCQRAEVVTCNSVPHPSNKIDLSDALSGALQTWLRG